MLPAGSYLDFDIAPGGAALWMQATAGAISVLLAPPTDVNLAAYVAWYACGRQAGRQLASHLTDAVRVEVGSVKSVFVLLVLFYVATVYLQYLSMHMVFTTVNSEQAQGKKRRPCYVATHLCDVVLS